MHSLAKGMATLLGVKHCEDDGKNAAASDLPSGIGSLTVGMLKHSIIFY